VLAQTSGQEQILVAVVSGLLLLAIPLFVRFLAGITKRLDKLTDTVEEVKGVLVTPAPTLLNPHPASGLIDTVAGLAKSSKINLEGTAALIKDSKPDDGSSSRDVLDRIDQATKEGSE
jgi:hypothetical protein